MLRPLFSASCTADIGSLITDHGLRCRCYVDDKQPFLLHLFPSVGMRSSKVNILSWGVVRHFDYAQSVVKKLRGATFFEGWNTILNEIFCTSHEYEYEQYDRWSQ